jgi:predicted ATPase
MLLNKTGDTAAGLPLLRSTLEELRDNRYAGHYMALLGVFAETLGRCGQTADGLVAIDEALAQSDRTEARVRVAELLRVKGELLLMQDAPNAAETAEDHFLRALHWARDQGALSWELRAASTLARLRQAQGRAKEARELLAPIYDRFTEGFGTADLQAAKTLLEAV